MPGYILHLTAAKMFWDRAKNQKLYNENDFYVGNLLPDATSDKRVSHFRSPELYYYGDFTKMNNYLIERFGLRFDFHVPKGERVIDEVNYEDIDFVLASLDEFTNTSIEAVKDLRVFELEDLLDFLKRIVEEW